jgi:hypothetical protein
MPIYHDAPDVKAVTGDHAKFVNVMTRSQDKMSARDALPKKAQELLDMEIRKYDGRCAKDAERWIKAIEEWVTRNQIRATEAFDFLLSEEASTLWNNFKTEKTTDKEAKDWFEETFTIKKSFIDKLKELAIVQQDSKERYATFEIRVLKLVQEVVNSGLNAEQITKDIVSDRVRNKKLRDDLRTKPQMSAKERGDLAKIFEAVETKERTEDIMVVKKTTYAEKVVESTNRRENIPFRNFNESRSFSGQRREQNNNPDDGQRRRPRYEQRQESTDFRPRRTIEYNNESRIMPTVSLKHIARKVYNRHKGLPDPRGGELLSGQCFCCGEHGHRRFECPLKDKCLICGKAGHNFRDCYLLKNNPRYNEGNARRIACIHDEEAQKDDDNNDYVEEYDDNAMGHRVDAEKNTRGSIAYISSMESQE